MKDLARFATSDLPLHPSGLRKLLICPWRAALEYLAQDEGEGGPAADTGSAVHAAAHAMHKHNKGIAAALEEMRARMKEYPQADLSEAAAMFLAYASDPRNRDARVVLSEEPIAFQIAPAPEDHTQEAIQVIGTVDQVREVDGQLYVYDLKTSKRDPQELLHDHTFQMAGYCIGASVKLGRQVNPGKLILTRKYTGAAAAGRCPVFWPYVWKFSDIEQIMLGVRSAVARIRRGEIWHMPNSDCKWCPMRSPELCFPKLQETLSCLRQTT